MRERDRGCYYRNPELAAAQKMKRPQGGFSSVGPRETNLEGEASGQLDLTGSGAFRDLHRGDLAKARRNRRVEVAGRRVVRMVEDIRDLRPDLKPRGFSDVESLQQGERNSFGSRPLEIAV